MWSRWKWQPCPPCHVLWRHLQPWSDPLLDQHQKRIILDGKNHFRFALIQLICQFKFIKRRFWRKEKQFSDCKKYSIILDLKYTIDVTRDVNIGFLRKPVILTIHGPLDKYFPGTSTERKNIPISVCSLVSNSHQKIPKFPTLVAAQQPPTADVWQCHLRADGLTPEISTEPSARSRVWENLYLF